MDRKGLKGYRTKSAVTHNDEYHLWQLDSLARAGVQEYTEKGTHTILAQEVEETKNKMHSIAGFFKGPAIPSGIGQRLMKFTVYPTHPLLSFMVRIVPSPDWFVGGDSIILCEANHWKELVTLDLYPYDAGTDSGFTFSSPNFATVPQDKITQRVRKARELVLTISRTIVVLSQVKGIAFTPQIHHRHVKDGQRQLILLIS
eukprot:g35983.t1